MNSPYYTCLSKRLAGLNIKVPRYRTSSATNDEVVAIAIYATGLKRFGRALGIKKNISYQQSGGSWRKLHIAVDTKHIIHASDLTDRFSEDCKSVESLERQIDCDIDHVTADGAYDKNPVYDILSNSFKNAEIVIPTDSDAVYDIKNHMQRNQNYQQIKTFGRMTWQSVRMYGRRNYSELAIQRYKKILGN